MALTDAEAEELVAHVAAMVKAGVPHTSTLHNWSITYTTREKKGANGAPRGDMCLVEPVSGNKIFSLVSLKRKLGLAPPLPDAPPPVYAADDWEEGGVRTSGREAKKPKLFDIEAKALRQQMELPKPKPKPKPKPPPPPPAFASCDLCGKWRRVRIAPLPTARWVCAMNSDAKFNRCAAKQELSNAEIDRLLGLAPAAAAEVTAAARADGRERRSSAGVASYAQLADGSLAAETAPSHLVLPSHLAPQSAPEREGSRAAAEAAAARAEGRVAPKGLTSWQKLLAIRGKYSDEQVRWCARPLFTAPLAALDRSSSWR